MSRISSIPVPLPTPRAPKVMCTNADRLVELLEAEGVDTVFGIVGGPITSMFDALSRRPHIRVVLCSDERGAVFAATGYADATGKTGVVVVTAGPGITNTVSAVACAYVDRKPLLILGGQVATKAYGAGAAQDSSELGVDVVAIMKPICVLSAAISAASHAQRLCAHALRKARNECRPAFLCLPADIAAAKITDEGPATPERAPTRPVLYDVQAAERVLPLLIGARRPALLLGHGATGARKEARLLAEELGAVVATTPRGKGVISEHHPLAVSVFGFAGTRWAEQALLHSEVDLLIVLGSSLNELASDSWNAGLRPAQMIHVDLDPSVIGTSYPANAVVGDVGAVIRHWLERLSEITRPRASSGWIAELKRRNPRVLEPDAQRSTEVPLRPERVFAELQMALPVNARVICDIGNTMAYLLHYLQLGEEQTFHINLGFACMGHAPGAAVGAALADPTRPVIALIGDAAFCMGGFEVHTAAEYCEAGRGPVFIVLNNGGNGMVASGVRAQYGADSKIPTGQYRKPLDIARIAQGMGASAVTVRAPGELVSALSAALLSAQGPTVIEVITASDADPPMGSRLRTLVGFAGGKEPA